MIALRTFGSSGGFEAREHRRGRNGCRRASPDRCSPGVPGVQAVRRNADVPGDDAPLAAGRTLYGRARLIKPRPTRWLAATCALLFVVLTPHGVAAEAEAQRAMAAAEAPRPIPSGIRGGRFRSPVESAWFGGGSALGARASEARRVALEAGLRNAGGPARALIARSRDHHDLSEVLLAAKLAPDLPMAHVAVASVRWRDGERAEALRSLISAVVAVPRNLEATLWLSSALLVFFVVVAVAGSIAFIAIVGVGLSPRAAHDLGDLVASRMPAFARAALLATLVLLPLALGEGLIGGVVALLFFAAMYGGARHRMALGLSAALLVLGLFPVAELAGRSLHMLSADPVAESALAVRQGIQTRDDLALLSAAQGKDLLAAHALAADARQRGRLDEALARYQGLANLRPNDATVATNLANLHFRRGDVDEALALYSRSTGLRDAPITWFNLSQAYARSFQMEPFEAALSRAQQLGDAQVAELSQLGDPALVADMPLPIGEIRSRMLVASQGTGFALALRAPVAPGRLGADWRWLSGTLAFMLFGGIALGGRFETAGTCTRCGVRVCARCDGTVWDSETCDNCHRLFHEPETTDASLRAVRIEKLRAREARVERYARLGSLLVPGLGGMAAGRPDLGLLAILSFGWVIAAVVMRHGVVPDPLVLGSIGPGLLLASAVFAAFAYAALVFASLVIRRSQ